MADPTLINGQITDSVTQANVKVLGDVPAQAMGTLYQAMAQSVGLAMQNAVANQQQMNTINAAATVQGVDLLYSLPATSALGGTNEIFSGSALAEMLGQLKSTVANFEDRTVQAAAAAGTPAELLGPAPAEATAVIYTQLAHAVGLAMQNIVSQQQTLNTINNAIATKALNLLADKDPAAALEQIRKQFDATMSSTVDALSSLAELTGEAG